ncbi:hypothetical protein C8Q70DRAFT_391459 [Cubamyces menziesii]|nr:hypothetical protein C8Q70DRAFT_391459 [Cubamyces menziesii]
MKLKVGRVGWLYLACSRPICGAGAALCPLPRAAAQVLCCGNIRPEVRTQGRPVTIFVPSGWPGCSFPSSVYRIEGHRGMRYPTL